MEEWFRYNDISQPQKNEVVLARTSDNKELIIRYRDDYITDYHTGQIVDCELIEWQKVSFLFFE